MTQEFDSLLKEAAQTYDTLRSSRFKRTQELGRGGMSVVYRAIDRKLDREVALKFLRADVEPDPEAKLRFQREAKVSAGLNHPNIVRVFDAGEESGRMYIVMECVEGQSLSEVLGARKFESPDMLKLLEKTARGVGEAHLHGIVHRDLKPANIMVTNEGEPKVADFGLALIMDYETTRLTQAGTSMGTPSYMAPEQVGNRPKDISARTDVYGLGAILYEVLTGRPPHTGDNPFEILAKIGVEDPIRPRRINPHVHPEVEAICLKALENDPSRRYADATQLADDLKNHFEGNTINARPVGPVTIARKWMRRNATLAAVAAALLMILAVWLGAETVHTVRVHALISRAESATSPAQRAEYLEQAYRISPDDPEVRDLWKNARNRADAVKFVGQARHLDIKLDRVEAEIARLEKKLKLAEIQSNTWDKEKPEIWSLRAQIRALEKKAAQIETEMLSGYANAVRLDDSYSVPRNILAEYYWEKYREAELAADDEKMAAHLVPVLQYEDGRYSRLLTATGALRIDSNVPGTRAVLHSFAAGEDGRLVPVNARALGECPVAEPELPPGSYLVVLSAAGYADVRYPVRIERRREHVAKVNLLRPEEIGEGFVYVPGGTMLSGEEDELRVVKVTPFVIAKFETTWSEFVEFLNETLGADASKRMEKTPESARPEWKRGADGRILLTGKADHPAEGVSWTEADAYCKWRSARDENADYRLPRTEEWELAARGVDGRHYPWGYAFDWSFTNGIRSKAIPTGSATVGSFVKDESVYGVRDMAGNVEEWCDGFFDKDRNLMNIFGGGWDDQETDDFKLGELDGDKPDIHEHAKGFRVVRVQSR